ncbi:MAG TPA: DSD1 family PLP-dependent enzyme [Blastocatellia bacterium]|nr:DSD1 family PLP-dependent enzyme [Blastocatellia bacterium]
MKTTRRDLLRGSIGLAAIGPTLLFSNKTRGYAHGEIAQRLSSGKGTTGITKHDLSTPSLLLDLDMFESNIAKMSEHVKAASINLRPHAKTHKCAEIAIRQIRAGALGVCAATIREAEAMAAASIKGILITSEMVGRQRIERLVRLTQKVADTASVVDNVAHAIDLNDAAQAAKTKLNVVIDIDPGMRRTGVPPGDRAVELAEKIKKLPGLNLQGVQCYSGVSAHVVGFEARRAHSEKATAPAFETIARLKKIGIEAGLVSGGSTGTYNIDPALKGLTELQAGSYVFMDVEYRNIGGKNGAVYDDFGQALTVVATVISQSHAGVATVDAGFKAFATDRRYGPDVKGVTGVKYHFGGDEHGILELEKPSREIRLGDRLEFIVPHCDPNVNLYDRIYCLRGEKLEAVWSISRGYA